MHKEYRIVEKQVEPYFTVIIIADKNDGDYVTTTNKYTIDEFNKEVVSAIKTLHELHGRDKLRMKYQEVIDKLNPLDIPHDEYGDTCHTLEDIVITYCNKSNIRYDIELKKELGENRIELDLNGAKHLVGFNHGEDIYNTQIHDNLTPDCLNTIVFPNSVEKASILFIKGLVKKLSITHSTHELLDYINFETNCQGLSNQFIRYMATY